MSDSIENMEGELGNSVIELLNQFEDVMDRLDVDNFPEVSIQLWNRVSYLADQVRQKHGYVDPAHENQTAGMTP